MKRTQVQPHGKLTPLTVPEVDELLNSFKIDPLDQVTNKKSIRIEEICQKIDEASHQMEMIFQEIARTRLVPIQEIKREILPTIIQAAEIPHLYHLFYELNEKDEYTYRHTICVGIIATIMGKWLGLNTKEMEELTLGATLHDIGKTVVPKEILNKPGPLTQEEYEEMKKHTMYGYELLKQIDGISERVALVALQHHEREDGKGYPFQLQGHELDVFSKIVAIADVFHAMSSARVYHQAEPFYVVIQQMKKDVFGKFDPNIMLIFLFKMMDSLVGRRVLLTDGSIGSIVMIHPYDPLKSLIRLDDQLIDLRYNTSLQIARILDDR
ncbi:HD-GYP domain-containing protein [Cytobacillus spongiae]|uniref:HD-GYP domain-containing protein n=1 Tax=Cytobacillus spongiae TaxID=2901381 RepID=UPI001F48FB9B|nr:HD-GYP domain-containing protein [Cytobacillus spongiae]UII54553.1 HD-GYP domain-containing protein [Cytobacillus spongiae]